MLQAAPTTQAEPAGETRGAAGLSGGYVLRAWIGFFLLASGVYALTADRGPQWQDSGQHIMRILDGEVVHELGLALSHPLHYWLGRLAVRLEIVPPAFAITLLSSLAAAIAVANVFGVVFTLTRQGTAAAFAALSLSVAHTFWQMATVAEVYTISAAILTAEVWCLLGYVLHRRSGLLLGAALLNGLGLANHNVALLTTPLLILIALLALVRGDVGKRHLAAGTALWLAGSALYTGLVLRELMTGGDLGGTLRSALFGHPYADEVLNVRVSLGMLALGAAYLAMNFPNLLLPLAGVGLVRSKTVGISPAARAVLYLSLILHAVFAFRYNVIDRCTFFLPTYALLAVFGGVGLAAVSRSRGAGARVLRGVAFGLLVVTPAVYVALPPVARQMDVLRGQVRNKPYRDDYAYIFTPWKGFEPSAARMAEAVLAAAGEKGLIMVPDSTAYSAVRYAALISTNARVEVVNRLDPERIHTALSAGAEVVYVPVRTLDPPPEAPVGEWQREGDLWVLKTGEGSASQPQ